MDDRVMVSLPLPMTTCMLVVSAVRSAVDEAFCTWKAVVLLLPLAATSFNRAMRALGGKRWQRLHQLVYAAACLAVLHFWWMRSGKQLFGEVWLYGGWLALALAWRVWRRFRP